MPNNPPAVDFWKSSLRPLAPGETDGEWLLFFLLPATAGIAVLWFWLGLPTPKCAIHEWTGIPCLTCGSTRMAGALLAGDWLRALRWNPLVFGSVLGLALLWVYSAAVCLFRWHRFRPALSRRVQFAVRVAIVALLFANWIYLIFALP